MPQEIQHLLIVPLRMGNLPLRKVEILRFLIQTLTGSILYGIVKML